MGEPLAPKIRAWHLFTVLFAIGMLFYILDGRTHAPRCASAATRRSH